MLIPDPEVIFRQEPDAEFEFDHDDTLIYEPATPEHITIAQIITIHHSNCFSDMIEAFSDPDTDHWK